MKQNAKYLRIVNDQRAEELSRRINAIVVGQKRYHDKNYTARQLVEDLGTNSRYVSVALRQSFGLNFRQYMNSLRVEEAKDILCDPDMDALSIEEVGDMVGFITRQSFHDSFRDFTGKTPGAWRKERNNE